jgi:cell shape-determining protein MreC
VALAGAKFIVGRRLNMLAEVTISDAVSLVEERARLVEAEVTTIELQVASDKDLLEQIRVLRQRIDDKQKLLVEKKAKLVLLREVLYDIQTPIEAVEGGLKGIGE